MTVCRTVKKGVFIDTNIDCQNCDSVKRICTWDGECENLEPMTNEEWFCSLPTEEKAKFLRQIYRDGRDDYVGEWYEQTESDFIEWLKQPHTTKE